LFKRLLHWTKIEALKTRHICIEMADEDEAVDFADV
jgi:hypothetical protein